MSEIKRNKRGYIVDEIYGKGVVRNCSSNVSKMNVFEWCYYKVFHWGYFSEAFGLMFEQGCEVVKNLVYLIINIIATILTPFVLIIMAYNDIKRSQHEVRNRHKYK